MPSIKYKEKTYAGASFPCLEVTKAEYDALSEEKKMDGTVYMITDGTGGWEAERSTYNNTESGLAATNVQDALDELTSSINNIVDTLITNVSWVDDRELAMETVRSYNEWGGLGTVSLSKGVYIAFSQSTTGSGYSGRAYCDFSGDNVSYVDNMPPTMPTNFGNIQITQLIIVASPQTVTRRYYDTQSTGAKHTWQIYRIL